MAEAIDPTFYRSPSAAIAAPPERLAYVAALDPAGSERDAITVVDCDAVDIGGWARLGSNPPANRGFLRADACPGVCPARSRLSTRERDLAVDLAVVGECGDVVRSRDPLRVAQQLGYLGQRAGVLVVQGSAPTSEPRAVRSAASLSPCRPA
jgi:hypothetical protein